MDISIKNIDETDWRFFKMESAKYNIKTSEMFSKLVKEHKKNCENTNWKDFLYSKKSLTDEDAIIIKEASNNFRKDFSFG